MKENLDNILQERNAKYGDWTTQAEVAQAIKNALKMGASYNSCTPAILEKLDMIANKMSRIVNGDPFYQDSWNDIAGYAMLSNGVTYSIDPNYMPKFHQNNVMDT